jgi:thiol:disulfide interchange protein DsbD
MRNIAFTVLFLTFWGFSSFAQLSNPVKWTFDKKKTSNTEYDLLFTATIEKGYHLYSDKLPEGGPIATTISYDSITGFSLEGLITTNTKPTKVFDKTFNMDLEYFSNKVTFIQRIKLTGNSTTQIKGRVEYMSCNDETCTPPTETEFSFVLNTEERTAVEKTDQSPKNIVPITTNNTPTTELALQEKTITVSLQRADHPIEKSENRGFWRFLLLAFVAGLAAVLTPCVFPMIPMTVSFFMRGNKTKGESVKTALFFGGSIVFIFALLGALFTFNIFGADAGNVLSTHWLPNAIFFLLFIVFALSFLGLFEIVLPGTLSNKTDEKADKGGLIGAFFMALTTVIVSFSCTGPFIGSLIIQAVQKGGYIPLFGMIAFGLAFAAPFTLLAFFPSAMKKLPKSGGWLNEVKVIFAFVLLAMSLKYLNVVIHDFVSREVFLAVWITLSILLGIYLLGKLRFSHDSEIKHISVGRFFLSLISFSFAIYLFTGLLGNQLTAVSSIVPASSVVTSTFVPAQAVAEPTITSIPQCGPAKYADKLHLPLGLSGYFELEQGLACAKEQNKPVFLVFKGHACANCKKMESTVWAVPEITQKLKNDFVIIALYTDDRTALLESEWKKSAIDGKILKTLGKVNLDLLMAKYNKNTIPYHVIIEPDGTEREMAVTYDKEVFSQFLSPDSK